MKRSKYHIISSWILLICFIAGQYMVYVHQHSVIKGGIKSYAVKTVPQTVVQEKCGLCDVMHHTAMDITSQIYFNPVAVTIHVFKSVSYNFRSIQLIIAAGRAPPQSYLNS